MTQLTTAESVTQGHPDKVADRISDTILDAILAKDTNARVAVETALGGNTVFLTGEVTTTASPDYVKLAKQAITSAGYNSPTFGYHPDDLTFITNISKQSPDIAQGLNGPHLGAGDQGIMFGYATTETPELMPLPITLAHKLAQQLTAKREDHTLPWLGPDGKTQVAVSYCPDTNRPTIANIVISAQHSPNATTTDIHKGITQHVITPILSHYPTTTNFTTFINPTGAFTKGGPAADAGLTGRKIIIDTYGGAAPHGGGAFSGKDPTKVDRSASYYARYIAKNVVAAGLAETCLVHLAYAIGIPHATGMRLTTTGNAAPTTAITHAVREVFNPSPHNMISELQLNRPIYTPTSSYGHFGRADFPWEATDKATALLEALPTR